MRRSSRGSVPGTSPAAPSPIPITRSSRKPSRTGPLSSSNGCCRATCRGRRCRVNLHGDRTAFFHVGAARIAPVQPTAQTPVPIHQLIILLGVSISLFFCPLLLRWPRNRRLSHHPPRDSHPCPRKGWNRRPKAHLASQARRSRGHASSCGHRARLRQ